jgi:hypothetical protein
MRTFKKREKIFGFRAKPLDREGKVRVMTLARALMRRTEKGKHYGKITAKALSVLEALLWSFHNARSGICFPSYERIAEEAGCCRSTVERAIKMLEDVGLLTWVHRLVRRKEHGETGWRIRVLRTSNNYIFADPRSSTKTEKPARTSHQVISFKKPEPKPDLFSPLEVAIQRLGKNICVYKT